MCTSSISGAIHVDDDDVFVVNDDDNDFNDDDDVNLDDDDNVIGSGGGVVGGVCRLLHHLPKVRAKNSRIVVSCGSKKRCKNSNAIGAQWTVADILFGISVASLSLFTFFRCHFRHFRCLFVPDIS